MKPDGQIEQTIDGTTSIIEEIKGTDGTMVFTTPEGEKMQANTQMLKVVDQRIIFRDNSSEPKTWIYDGQTLIIREYAPPESAGWVTYEDNLSEADFEINKAQADEKAVYENFLSLLPNSLKKTPWNEAITKIVLEKNPDLQIVANASPREKRIVFMQAFLQESGGIIDIYNPLNITTIEGADLNLPVVHKSMEKSQIPEGFFLINGSSADGLHIYGNIYINEGGQASIVLLHELGALKALYKDRFYDFGWDMATLESYNFHAFLQYFGAGSSNTPAWKGKLVSYPGVYLFGNGIFQMKGDEYLGFSWFKTTRGFLK